MTNNTQPHFFCESDQLYLVWAHAVSYPYDHDVYFERFTYSGTAESPEKPNVASFSLSIEPNPCIHGAKITMNGATDDGSGISVAIYDISGRLLRELSFTHLQMPISFFWDGKDESGAPVPTGVYFIQAKHASKRFSRMATFIR